MGRWYGAAIDAVGVVSVVAVVSVDVAAVPSRVYVPGLIRPLDGY